MMKMQDPEISIIVPVYNELSNLPDLTSRLEKVLEACPSYEIIYIDDGSTDESISFLKEYNKRNSRINYLSFSRNFGHQAALKAGFDYARGRCIISLDGDLQHTPELIPLLIDKWKAGFDIVNTIRKDDERLSFFKKKTSKLFYDIMNIVASIKMTPGMADFRLLDRRIVDIIREFSDNNLFIRGVISWIGFKQTSIEYTTAKRHAGSSKYTFKKMLKFALNGITGFSTRPLQLPTAAGATMLSLVLFYAFYCLGSVLVNYPSPPVWINIIAGIFFVGGMNLLCMGIIGYYLGVLVIASKNRPAYIVKEKSFSLSRPFEHEPALYNNEK